VDLLIDAKVVI